MRFWASDASALDVADPAALDPVEELERQDRQVLLDKALGHLSRTTREAVELYYLAELPQREVAIHLGMTIHALEERLYRARRQLHQLLHTKLRSDAEAFGLLLDPDETASWRGTRKWCHFCGRQRELGLLEFRDGMGKLHTRCPVCSHLYGDSNTSGWLPELVGMHSFRPALNRLNSHLKPYMTQALATGNYPCDDCGQEARIRLTKPGEPYGYFTRAHAHHSLVLECPTCKWFSGMWACGATFWSDPAPNAFMRQHPRWIIGPELFVEYENQPALRFCLCDTLTEARLIIIAHAQTLQVLAIYEE